ncbi:MAG: hypothetical protein K9J81_12725 [Desulfohalobiaceae bacterium]|nr:hypothetical protein [Desulfohalobiaceae bacterium]
MTELRELQEQDLEQVLWPEGETLSVTRTVSLDELQLALSSRQNRFELSGRLEVDPETVLELKSLLQAAPKGRFVPLDSKRYAVLSRGLRSRIRVKRFRGKFRKFKTIPFGRPGVRFLFWKTDSRPQFP